jgi:hypothetical protein
MFILVLSKKNLDEEAAIFRIISSLIVGARKN